jgi:hypothetical protein
MDSIELKMGEALRVTIAGTNIALSVAYGPQAILVWDGFNKVYQVNLVADDTTCADFIKEE